MYQHKNLFNLSVFYQTVFFYHLLLQGYSRSKAYVAAQGESFQLLSLLKIPAQFKQLLFHKPHVDTPGYIPVMCTNGTPKCLIIQYSTCHISTCHIWKMSNPISTVPIVQLSTRCGSHQKFTCNHFLCFSNKKIKCYFNYYRAHCTTSTCPIK